MDNLFLSKENSEKERKQSKLKQHTEQTVKSLKEVENFLNQTKKALNHIKLYKILK